MFKPVRVTAANLKPSDITASEVLENFDLLDEMRY